MAGLAEFSGQLGLMELAESTAARIGAAPRRIILERGESLIRSDEAARGLWFLRKGALRVSLLEENGREVLLALVERGEVLGELEFFLGGDFLCEVRATRPSELSYFPRSLMESCVAAEPEIAMELGRVMARRLKRNSTRVSASLSYPLPYLVLKALLGGLGEAEPGKAELGEAKPGKAEARGRGSRLAGCGGGIDAVDEGFGIGELAEYVGCSSRQISRILAAFQAEGLIRRSGRRVSAADPGRILKRLARFENPLACLWARLLSRREA